MIIFFAFLAFLLLLGAIIWDSMYPGMPARNGPGWMLIAAAGSLLIAMCIGMGRDIAKKDREYDLHRRNEDNYG